MIKNVDVENTKQKIIDATIELMKEIGDISKISIRKIVKRAGIKGVGLINYHFRTKENLINEAVRKDTNAIIDQWDPIYEKMTQKPIEKLKIMLKGTGDLIDSNPIFGRVSIIHDFLNPAEDDNAMRSIEKYMMIFREIYQNTKTEQEIRIIAHTIISSSQVAFLRADIMKKFIDLDFYNKKQRDTFLDTIIDNVIKQNGND